MTATIRDIASRAGVSHMTVSNVLNNRLKATRPDAAARANRIRVIAKEMGYRPHAAARSMTHGRTRTVAVAIRDERFGYEALLGLNRVVESSGYILALVPMDDIVGDERPKSRLFAERLVDGLAVLSCDPGDIARLDERLPDLRDRTVYIDTNRYGPHGCVRRDEAQAGRLAANRLIDAGFKHIAYFDRPDETLTYCFAERREAALACCRERGVDMTRVPVPVDRLGYPDAAAVEDLRDAYPWRCTALLAADATMARLVHACWTHHRLAPGVDYGLASCDETSEEAHLWPQLSRVSFDRAAMGEAGGRMMLRLLADEQPTPSTRISGQWIAGRTATLCPVSFQTP